MAKRRLTDVVKRATPNIDHVSSEEFRRGGRVLRAKLEPLAPCVIGFVGLVGYRLAFDRQARLGRQPEPWGRARLFIVPSPSPRNAFYRGDIVAWFRRLREYRDELKGVGE